MIREIKESKYFDSAWYCSRYPDVELSGIEAAEHYYIIGAHLQRDPGPQFSVRNYLINNPDIASTDLSGFLHYIEYGRQEKRGGFAPTVELVAQPVNPSHKVSPAIKREVSTLKSESQKDSASKKDKIASTNKKVVGDLNMPSTKAPLLRGWVAEIGQEVPRTAVLQIDGINVLEVIADQFRADLKKNNINGGCHAFETAVPLAYIDGKEHEICLLDKTTGIILKRRSASWSHNRNYVDFEGFLANSCVSPYISRPFREEDKRCFAAMENIADHLGMKRAETSAPPLISVLMPCYNRIDTIEEAVQSVLNQDYENFELIIIDDASTDGTLAWCKELRDDRVKIIALKENSGAAAARNAGLKKSRGRYIAYLDSDNRWDQRYLNVMIGAFQMLPDADAVFSGQYIYHGSSTEPAAVRFGSLNKSLLFNHNYIDMNAFCHTRVSYKKLGGFDIALKRFIDWDLILRFAQAGNMYSIPVLLCHYYLGKASNTITADQRYLNQLGQVREKNAIKVDKESDTPESLVLSIPQEKHALTRKVSIIIPSYEALSDLSACIDSILTVTDRGMVDIIVVDNASAQPITDYLAKLTSQGVIKSICNPFNYGFTYAVNQGISIADPTSDLILLNNDSIITNGAIEALQKSAYELPDCGLVVPQQVLPGGTKTIQEHVPYANREYSCDVNLSAHHANIINPPMFNNGEITEISFAPFFCVYIPRHVYSKVGPLDAQYGRHYRSDRIYCDVIRHIHKLKIYHVYQSLVLHKLQKATDMLRQDKAATTEFELIFKKNQWDEESRKKLGFANASWDY